MVARRTHLKHWNCKARQDLLVDFDVSGFCLAVQTQFAKEIIDIDIYIVEAFFSCLFLFLNFNFSSCGWRPKSSKSVLASCLKSLEGVHPHQPSSL